MIARGDVQVGSMFCCRLTYFCVNGCCGGRRQACPCRQNALICVTGPIQQQRQNMPCAVLRGLQV